MLHSSFTTLLRSLNQTLSLQDKREAIDLCKYGLERLPNDVQNLSKRHHILTEMLCAAYTLEQDDIQDATLSTILDEVAGRNGNEYGKEVWSIENWVSIIVCSIESSDGLDLIEQLTKAALKWAVSKYGLDRIEGLYFLNLRADGLRKMRRFGEAETVARDCIARVVHTSWPINDFYLVSVHEMLGDILDDQERHEEAYVEYNLALLHARGLGPEHTRMRLLRQCATAAMGFNFALADAYWTLRLQLAKDAGNWDGVIENIMDLCKAKSRTGTKTAIQGILDVLVDGLEMYGLEITYRENNTRRKHLREINATINLEDPNLVRSLVDDESVQESLVKELDGWYGFDLLIRTATELAQTGNVDAAEQAFQVAKTTAEKTANMSESDMTDFVQAVLIYALWYSEINGDRKRMKDVVEWAKLFVCDKRENGMDGLGDWWAGVTKARRRHRVGPRTLQGLS
ncbi:hypothetical protein F4818DRAFT_354243 [Hypoxylon cercidicola]|nr:hypothetical protein F4818DRAFT_354243 [Hypoxylon cercidicola]